MSNINSDGHRKRRRFAPLVWISGGLAAFLMVLGVSGTLSSWTTAIINNDSNTAKAAGSVILEETSGANTCVSNDDGTSTNSFTCSTINKYGGVSTPMDTDPSTPAPNTQSVTVTMKNTGTDTGNLTLVANGCTKSGGVTGAPDLCAQMEVTVECPTPTNVYGPDTLANFSTDSTATPLAIGSLASQASITCTFTVTLPLTTSPAYAGQTVSQPLAWTLAV